MSSNLSSSAYLHALLEVALNSMLTYVTINAGFCLINLSQLNLTSLTEHNIRCLWIATNFAIKLFLFFFLLHPIKTLHGTMVKC